MVVGGLRLIEWRRETFICGSILWIALEKLKIMKRVNMLGFYRKGSFMDWVGCWSCLFAGGRVFFCRLHASVGLVFSKFVDCKGREMEFAGNSLVLEAIED